MAAYSEVAALTNFTNGALIVDTEVEADFAAIRTPVNALIAGVNAGTLFTSIATGITASTTQSQGQQPLTAVVNIVETVANTDDVVTLPAAAAGKVCLVRNAGSNTLGVYAASGDEIVGASLVSLSVGAGMVCVAVDATDWWIF